MNESENFALTVPVKIPYSTIEKFLQKKFIGEIISKEKASGKSIKYAEIVDISLSNGNSDIYDLSVIMGLRMLTVLYMNKVVDIQIDANIDFDSTLQKVAIGNYKIDSRGLNFFADNILESVVNTFMYSKFKQKLNFNLMPKLSEELESLNVKLADKFEAKPGINILGAMDKLEIADLQARNNQLWIFIFLNGWALIEIDEISL